MCYTQVLIKEKKTLPIKFAPETGKNVIIPSNRMKQSFEHRDDALYTFYQNKIKGRQLLLKTIYSCRENYVFLVLFVSLLL